MAYNGCLNVNLQSEDEGALTIYQRPAELPLAVLEDFDDFSLDDDALQVNTLMIKTHWLSQWHSSWLLIMYFCGFVFVNFFLILLIILIRSCRNLLHRHGGQGRHAATVRCWKMMEMHKLLLPLSCVCNSLILMLRCVIFIYSQCEEGSTLALGTH